MSKIDQTETLLKLSQSCRIKYPNMVPIRISVQEGLISNKIYGLQLQRNILKYVQRQISQTLYFFVVDNKKHRMLHKNSSVGDTFKLYKNKQGFLHIKVMKENVF